MLGVLALVAGTVTLVAHAYTELLWFRELGQERVFWTTLKWKLLGHGVPAFGTASFLLVNFAAVERAMASEPQVRPYRRLAYPVVAIGAGVLASQWHGSGAWRLLALWHGRSDFGFDDPLFHRDVGFFVFSLPLYQQIVQWLLDTLAVGAAATVLAYVVAGGLRRSSPYIAARGVRAHLLVLASLALVVVAGRYRLDQLALALPERGAATAGAGYTAVHVRLPTLKLLELLALAAAALVLYAATRPVPRRPVAVLIALAVLALTAPGVVAREVERLAVQPQVLTRERPYLAESIAATRRAYALDDVTVRGVPAGSGLSEEDLAEHETTLANLPLWDGGVLRPAMDDLQSIGRYYRFPSLTVDRYRVDGETRVVTIGARQLDRRALGPESRGWTNDRFAYTHGYGVVAVTSPHADATGQPAFADGDFRSGPELLGLREPRIYYAERAGPDPPYLIVGSGRSEVDAPVPGSSQPEYHYDGPGGITLSNPLRRAAFAVRFGDLKLLLTESITETSRIVLHRKAGERVRALAPFLRWDTHPQTVVAGGRVQFLFHGYTTSSHYPYSAPIRFGGDEVNYLRAPAVAAVDAFSGRIGLYADDAEDPVMRAWSGTFPGVFQPLERMPAELREHLRYPRRLFAAQADVYASYHAVDTTGFWNGADAWQRPLQIAGPVENAGEIRFPDPEDRLDADERDELESWVLRPRYVLARLPGDDAERFMLVMPFAPRGRQNLVSYLSGTVDEAGRPQLTALSLPRDRLAVGPAQATRRILADEGVSRRLQLVNRESRDLGRAAVSRTILGTPRVIPVAGALVHVQPLYVTAGGGGVPRLQLVTVHANGRVGVGRDVESALRDAIAPPPG